MSAASISLSGTAEIKTTGYNGTSGFRLSAANGLEIPNNSIAAGKIILNSTFADSVAAATTTIDGGKIKTGSIQSNATATVYKTYPIYDDNGTIIDYGNPVEVVDPTPRPAWTINTTGAAEFSRLSVRGNAVVGNPDTTDSFETAWTYANSTSGSPVFNQAGGGADFFKISDTGLTVTGPNIPADTVILTVNTNRQVTLSKNATATGTPTVINVQRPIRYVASLASANYIAGTQGWILRSDGTGELRGLMADTIDGSAIRANTLYAEALASGVITADMTLSGSFKTASNPTNVFLTFASGSTTVNVGSESSGLFSFDSTDQGVSISGFGIQSDTVITSVNSNTSVTISKPTTSARTNVSGQVYRGRTVEISGVDGIILRDQYHTPVVTLPTDPLQPATFAGSIIADDIYIRDDLRMFGIKNSVGQGAVLSLDSGSYVAPSPRVAYAWDNILMSTYNGTENAVYRPDKDPYVLRPTSPFWDDATKHYYWTSFFYGSNLFRNWGPGNTAFAADGVQDFTISLSNTLDGGANAEVKAMTADATHFWFLTRHNVTGVWRMQAITRTGVLRSGGPVAGDRASNLVWADAASNGGIVDDSPAIAIFGGKMFIAKRRPTDSRIVLYRYPALAVSAAPELTSSPLTITGNVQSMVVGPFDYAGVYGSNYNYVVISTTGSNGNRMVNVFRIDSGGFANTSIGFNFPFDEYPLGTVWMGSSTSDATGHFRSISTAGRISTHTQLGWNTGETQLRVSARWRNDGTNVSFVDANGVTRGGTAAKGLGPESGVSVTTMKRRSNAYITTPTPIPDNSGDSPNAVTFYAGIGTDTRYRLTELPKGVRESILSVHRTSDAASDAAGLNMKVGTPAKVLGTNLEITGDGSVKTNNPSIGLYSTTATSLSANVWTKIGMTSDPRFATRGNISTQSSAIKINVSGWYNISGGLTWGTGSTGTRYLGIVRSDSDALPSWVASNILIEDSGTVSANNARQSVATTVYLNAGEFIMLGALTSVAVSTNSVASTSGWQYHFLRATYVP